MQQFCDQLDVTQAAGIIAKRAAVSRASGSLVKAADWRVELDAFVEKHAGLGDIANTVGRFGKDVLNAKPGDTSSPTFARDSAMESLRNSLIGGAVGAGVGGVSEIFSDRRKKRYMQRMLQGGLLGGAIGGGGTAAYRGAQYMTGPKLSDNQKADSAADAEHGRWVRSNRNSALMPNRAAQAAKRGREFPNETPEQIEAHLSSIYGAPDAEDTSTTNALSDAASSTVSGLNTNLAIGSRFQDAIEAGKSHSLPGAIAAGSPNVGAGLTAATATGLGQSLWRRRGDGEAMRNWARENKAQFKEMFPDAKPGTRSKFKANKIPVSQLPAAGLHDLRGKAKLKRPKRGIMGIAGPALGYFLGSGYNPGTE